MKKRLMAIAGLLSLFGILAIPMAVHASNNARGGDIVTVAKDEVVDTTTYLAGSTVTVAGQIRGDLYCAGQNVDISGTVEGDVFCAGQNINIGGNVLGSVHVAGQTITMSGPVGRSLSAFGQTIAMTGNSVVNADATIFGSSLQLGGKIGRDATLGGQNATLAGTIGRNTTVEAEQVTAANGARIGGNLDYTSRNQAAVSGATILGTTQRHEPQTMQREAVKPMNLWVAALWSVIYWFSAILFLGLVLAGLAPRSYQVAGKIMIQQCGWAMLAGIIALVMVPVVSVMLMVTVVGIPLGIVMMLLWTVALFAGFAYSGYSMGAWVAGRASWNVKWPRALALLIGLLILSALMLIPVVGGLFGFLALVWGLGGIVLMANEYLKTRKNGLEIAKKAKA